MKALKVKLGRKTLTELAKRFGDGPFPAKWKRHDGRVRLIVELKELKRSEKRRQSEL
jgi:hypothetical protein